MDLLGERSDMNNKPKLIWQAVLDKYTLDVCEAAHGSEVHGELPSDLADEDRCRCRCYRVIEGNRGWIAGEPDESHRPELVYQENNWLKVANTRLAWYVKSLEDERDQLRKTLENIRTSLIPS